MNRLAAAGAAGLAAAATGVAMAAAGSAVGSEAAGSAAGSEAAATEVATEAVATEAVAAAAQSQALALKMGLSLMQYAGPPGTQGLHWLCGRWARRSSPRAEGLPPQRGVRAPGSRRLRWLWLLEHR